MMFYVSQVLWLVGKPVNLFIEVVLVGLILAAVGKRRTASRVLIATGALFLVLGFSPLGNFLLYQLENTYHPPSIEDMKDFTGIIVLGGNLKTDAKGNVAPELTPDGERLIEAVKLAKLFPSVPIVYSGGTSNFFDTEVKEADIAAPYFAKAGIREPRLKLERASRNTEENAKFTAAIVKPKPGQRWLLVTSAFHMARAKALFERQGFTIEPWPVAYRTSPAHKFAFSANPLRGIEAVQLVLKEELSTLMSWLDGSLTR